MPRNHNPGPSTLRNRNRVTNKTRLRVITESIDADPIVVDEDEEKARVVSTAGVDAEDANEHHLQAVLSAAAARHQPTARSTRAAQEKEKPAAYIPTPDSTGLVDNYDELYPPSKWKDPTTYLKFSDTVEESVSYALLGGHIYYMDERDKEWLDKNNEEARGEGTSAQGALPASGSGFRSSRSAKAKGKEPEVVGAVGMNEDAFELAMAVFEKVTHEKTEFLHHGLANGAPFPPFSDYEDTFANELRPDIFALFMKPDWVPEPATLLRIARVVYPYWRERREERQGHRIIPAVNLDETDTLNESYVCFRRRELKAVRKTRAQQATYSDKMLRLSGELDVVKAIADSTIERERLKRTYYGEQQSVWEKRLALVDLRRKFPSLTAKEDDELFVDKERVPKKPKLETAAPRIPLKIRTKENGETASPVTVPEPAIKPKERLLQIRQHVDLDMMRQKEKDRAWEDVIDNAYQPQPVPYAAKLYKYVAASRASSSAKTIEETDEEESRPYRAGRLRYGRGGRLHLDRRVVSNRGARHPMLSDDESEGEDETDVEVRQFKQRTAERWKFDADDDPAVGPEGPDEHDRVLYDDYQPKHLSYHMSLLNEQDQLSLLVDGSVAINTAEGRKETNPFKALQQLLATPTRRDMPPNARASMIPGQPISSMHHAAAAAANGAMAQSSGVNGGLPVATQMKKMPPPAALPHMRISSNGGIRLPAPSPVPNLHSTPSVPSGSALAASPSNGQGAGASDAGTAADGEQQDLKRSPQVNGAGSVHGADAPAVDGMVPVPASTSPARAKAQIQPMPMGAVPNGYLPVNAYSGNAANMQQYMQQHGVRAGLSQQQLKSAIANMSPAPDASLQARAQMYMGTAGNFNQAQLRQWANMVAQQHQPHQRPPSVNGVDAGAEGGAAMPPSMPARVPSANGMRTASMSRQGVPPGMNGQGRTSPTNAQIARLTGPQHSPSPMLLSPSLSSVQSSPTRAPSTLGAPSPNLQTRQIIGSSGAGY